MKMFLVFGKLVIPSDSKIYVDTAVLIYTLEISQSIFKRCFINPLLLKKKDGFAALYRKNPGLEILLTTLCSIGNFPSLSNIS